MPTDLKIKINKMEALLIRIQKALKPTAKVLGTSEDEDMSADKLFLAFLLVGLAKEHGLLDDNCNRAVQIALHAVGMAEEKVPSYIRNREKKDV